MERSVETPSIDWSVIFDLIASEYGYTWEQFTGMTYKALQACIRAIDKRTHNNYVAKAALHGIKIDLYQRIKPPSEESLKQAEASALKLLKEKQVAIKNGKR